MKKRLGRVYILLFIVGRFVKFVLLALTLMLWGWDVRFIDVRGCKIGPV